MGISCGKAKFLHFHQIVIASLSCDTHHRPAAKGMPLTITPLNQPRFGRNEGRGSMEMPWRLWKPIESHWPSVLFQRNVRFYRQQCMVAASSSSACVSIELAFILLHPMKNVQLCH